MKIVFDLMRRTHTRNLSKHFRNTLYIKNSWERGDEEFIFIKVGGAKMHNATLHDYRASQVFPLRYVVFVMHSRFWNMPYNTVHTTETTALSRSWKKTPIGIRVSVSKVYIISFCGAAFKMKARVTVCWGFYITHKIRHTQNWTHTHTKQYSSEWV